MKSYKLTEHAGETFTGSMHLYDEAGNLVAEIRGLQLKRATRETLLRAVRPHHEDWYYRVDWQEKPLELPSMPLMSPRKWLVLADRGGVGAAVLECLRLNGIAFHDIKPGEDIPDLKEIVGLEIIYLRGLEAVISAQAGAQDLLDDALTPNSEVVKLVKKMQQSPAENNRLWLVTCKAQPTGQANLEPLQASLWGLGRVIALEHPDIWGGLIDLGGENLAEDANLLFSEIQNNDGEDQVAYRKGKRLAPRLLHARKPEAQGDPINKLGTILVTGGLGGLGLQVASWMAKQGATHMVLTGRHGLPERSEWDRLPTENLTHNQITAIRMIEDLGCKVDVEAVDASDYTAMEKLFASFGTTRPALSGIVHTAAALSSCSIGEMTDEVLRSMFSPKIAGTWNLHLLTRDLKLDFFVVFSSTTALWGSSLLGHYAAANTFLDTFAHYRQASGLPAVSINWGTWDVMRAASLGEQAKVVQFGLNQMPAEAALGILGGLLNSPMALVAIASVDWHVLKPAYEARRKRPLLEKIDLGIPTQMGGRLKKKAATLMEQLKSIPIEDRKEFILRVVREQVAQVISNPEPASLDIHQGLFEMGLDSLMSVELKSLLEASVEQALPSTLTFNYPTIADLANYLEKEIQGQLFTVTASHLQTKSAEDLPSTTGPLPGEQDKILTEDELAELLTAKLLKLKK